MEYLEARFATKQVVKHLRFLSRQTGFAVGLVAIITLLTYQKSAAQCAGFSAPTVSASLHPLSCLSSSTNLASLISSTAPSGTTLEWHSASANPSTATIAAMPVSTTGTYYAYYHDAVNNCYSPASAAVTVINQVVPIPTITLVDATRCTSPNGTITITAPLGNYQFSIDGGSTYSTSTSFTDLGSGYYSVQVRDTATGCLSNKIVKTLNCPG